MAKPNVLNYGPRMSRERAASFGVFDGAKDMLAGDGGHFTTYAEAPNGDEREDEHENGVPHAARYPMKLEKVNGGWNITHGPMSEQEMREHVEEDLSEENGDEEEEEETEHEIINKLVSIISQLIDILSR